MSRKTVSIIIPTLNEKGTIHTVFRLMPSFPRYTTELVFVDGHSTDGTWVEIQREAKRWNTESRRKAIFLRQKGKGKWDAVRLGLQKSTGEYCIIYDSDMSVPIQSLPVFLKTLIENSSSLVIGSRFIFPQESGAMRVLNHTGNLFFSLVFSVMSGKKITDTLCGTKCMDRKLYLQIMNITKTFQSHDPYGDFTLLLGAILLGIPIIEVPIAYRARVYGVSKISRFRDGMKLLVVLMYAAHEFIMKYVSKKKRI